MKKIFLLAVLSLISVSCASTKNSMDGYVGKTKQNFMKTWGTPIRTVNNDQKEEILIYADQVYTNPTNNHNDSSEANYWNYTFVYVNTAGNIVSWRKEKQFFPPQQISANELTGSNTISAK